MRARVQRGGRWRTMALVGLAALATAPLGQGKPRPTPTKITPQVLEALAREYLDAGLPPPPADAPLTAAPSGSVQGRPEGGYQDLCVVGFRTADAPANDDRAVGTLLMGTREILARITGAVGEVAPRRLAAGDGLPTGVRWATNDELTGATYPVNNWLLLAAQCQLRGHERAAREILARGLAREDPTAARLTPLGDGSPRDALAASAWNYWLNFQSKPDADRHAALAHLEKLAAAFPGSLDGERQRDLLASLRLALVPPDQREAPDSDAGLVAGLVDHVADPSAGQGDADDRNYVEIQRRGFAAVPALLAHLDDRRLARGAGAGPDGLYGPQHVGEIACDLLCLIAGERASGDELAGLHPPGQLPDQACAARWWADAAALGEESYMTTRVFPPSEVSLRILSERYPGRLAEVYTRCLSDSPENSTFSVAQAISDCAELPREERCRLLRAGTESPRLNHCIEALGVLGAFDRRAADAALVACLDRWPTEASGSYRLRPPETRIGECLLETDAVEAWQAYERALFRASVGLRAEMLARLSEVPGVGSPQVRQLALLDLFLDDPEVRVVRPEDTRPGGRYEGQEFPAEERRLRLGDYVARLIDRMFQLKPPTGAVHDERWHARHRAAAREAIDQQARQALQASPD